MVLSSALSPKVAPLGIKFLFLVTYIVKLSQNNPEDDPKDEVSYFKYPVDRCRVYVPGFWGL